MGILLALGTAVYIAFYAVNNMEFSLFSDEAQVYEYRWDIRLPDDMELTYKKIGSFGIHGEGARYAVFQMKKYEEAFLREFSNEENAELEQNVTSLLTGRGSSSLGVKSNMAPDFSEEYLWRELRNDYELLYMIYSQTKFYCLQLIW